MDDVKHRDWWIAGTLVILGLLCLIAASFGIRPMWWSMGSMMVWTMFVPWLVFIGLIIALLSFGVWFVPKALNVTSRHRCSVCGERRIHADWEHCPHCGAELRLTKPH